MATEQHYRVNRDCRYPNFMGAVVRRHNNTPSYADLTALEPERVVFVTVLESGPAPDCPPPRQVLVVRAGALTKVPTKEDR